MKLMDLKALDKALQKIVAIRMELSKIDYSSPKYDELEEKVHDLEDDFQVEYGEYMESVLKKLHDEHSLTNDVLLPIAYLGRGVPIELEKYPGTNVKMALEVNPPRFYLRLGDKQQLLWEGN